ncbi:MAG: hypothetical protein WAW39_03485 [Prosthecobacter sp.]|uniref:hypothetical protein n=1 Tax=Prosthecobacter sp. TaxID=1965333 RepID=UPI003BAF542A
MHPPPLLALIFGIVLGFSGLSHADAPATEFFAIETSKLTKLAPTDADLDSLSRNQLDEVSLAHGWYNGGLAMRFDTATFRMDARFSDSAHTPTGDPASIGYNICASNNQKTWSLLAVQGSATRLGKQFVTENWRTQPVTVVLRFLNLKR